MEFSRRWLDIYTALSALALIACLVLPGTVFAQIPLSHYDQVQQMYVAYYGRPGDAGGLAFWEGRLAAADGDLGEIINEFGTSEEFVSRFGDLGNTELVDQIYIRLFARDADSDGLAFYVDSLNAGTRTLGSIALDIVNGATVGSDDARSIINKVTIANYVSNALDTRGADYSPAIVDKLQDLLLDITAEFAAFDALYPLIDELADAVASGSFGESDPKPIVFHCTKEPSCPEIFIGGDPHAETGNKPQVFRGYGDPSLEFDEESGDLWLAYSWLDIQTVIEGPPAEPDLLVRTHLARSLDNGNTFEFVRAVNSTELVNHPGNGQQGWLIHEVPTITRQPDGQWQTLWLQYFDPVGAAQRFDFQFNRSLAATAVAMGDAQEAWSRTVATTPAFDAPLRFESIAEISDCTLLTEPALFTHNGVAYLAALCLVVDDSGRRPELERIVLLRDEGDQHAFVGNLLNAADFADLGGDVLTQPDLSVSRDGTLLLTVTPKLFGQNPEHQGCIVLAVENISQARVARDSEGAAMRRAIITSDGNGLGPGLCTYDPESNSGVMLVITTFSNDPFNVEFSLRATGVHP